MSMKSKVSLVALMGLLLLPALVARAVPIVTDTFTGSDHNGWALTSGNGSVVPGSDDVFAWTGGDAGTELVTGTFESTTSLVATYNGGDWAGSTAQSLQFDFDASAGSPAAFTIFFEDATYGQWRYNFPTTSTGTQTVNLTYGSGWYRASGLDTEEQFNLALASVDLVGAEITYRAFESDQSYAFDNFALNDQPISSTAIPEPEVYVMLATVLVSLGMFFRRELRAALPA